MVDAALRALADEFVANDRALGRLLAGDGRDTDDIPVFSSLADRQAELVGLIAGAPAQGSAGLLAKARCARLHPAERGFDAAVALSLSVADDLIRIGVPSPLPPSGLFRSGPNTMSYGEERIMSDHSDADLRLATSRRNELWRHANNTLAMIGASAVVALITLPADGIGLTWFAVAALLATGALSIGLALVLLRFLDPPE